MSDTPVSGSGSSEFCSSHGEVTSEIILGDGQLSLKSQRCGAAIVVAVAGEVDLLIAERLREVLIEQVGARPDVLVVDLEEVLFFGSTGLTALALTRRAASELGVELRVVATKRSTLRPMQVTGMADELAIYSSREDALAGCSGGRA
ncbi:MAG TPA: STAS domain-containing protein [Pseudonocardiaceae bacterium]|nr:STAS domain-containing protein [Pseudonocardiaceae bacterium]